MKEKPLVSICLPVYNKSTYLNKTLKSLSNQTYKKLDIIISDDHSDDKSVLKVINDWLQKDNRIRFYEQQINIGPTNNYLFVLNKARGKYVLLASEDDLWHETYIEEGINFLENNSSFDVWNSSICQIDSYDQLLRILPTFDRFTSNGTSSNNIIKYAALRF